MTERLLKLDANGDGSLSADELTKLPEGGQRLIKFADRDEDGALSSEELTNMKDRGAEMRRERQQNEQSE
ncbi:hypothetical protein [Allorhodopirellula heiligendammensis]|uniref:EF hand n=1 Tax=Allorhodopirellula heiligendammensis TaxID=2714739 RepID=A0A5C6BXL7_9BACT|nr:hypothetical protein [Allorhodopirellula heiligendammensis]TWU15419.1 EF hand [Allorhodopirellula heiligendammensis]